MTRQNISGNSPYEAVVGYCRAVRLGNLVFVAGTTATNDAGEVIGPGDPYAQAMQAFTNIAKALEAAGATMANVVRTRMFVTDIAAHAGEIGRAHGEWFRDIRPVATMVQVGSLIDPAMLVEVEVDAVVTDAV
jgi:enamine deaminase RidA (YjgF/YER057c/UK114 family)